LKKLELESNLIESDVAEELSMLEMIEILNLKDNKISEIKNIQRMLYTMKNLRELFLVQNPVVQICRKYRDLIVMVADKLGI
jgi:hypothetical protein